MNSRIFVTLMTILVAFATFSADEIAPRTDPEFAAKMAQGGMCKIKASEMAQRKSSNASVKSFADMMVSEHSQANSELISLADKKGWTLPKALDDKHQGKIDMLQAAAEGATFDQEYASMMVKAHSKGADMLRSASTTAGDADLRAFATKTLAMIEKHKSHASDLAIAVGVPPTPVKASFREVHREALGLKDTDTTTNTQEAPQQTNRAQNNGTVIESNTPATTDSTQDATKRTNRAAQEPGLFDTCPVNYSRNPAPGGNQPATPGSIQYNTQKE